MTPLKPIDKNDFITPLKEMLSHTRTDLRATPDVSAILPFIRDTFIEEIVLHCNWNQAKASRILGMNRGTLRTHIARIQMQKTPRK
ncbi:hypothetical protein F7U66_00390 [Vibrio parahaemolyticus]|nr:hypothetical protein [Vibrio parahaemolyticus]